jgi:hypothetical protein
MPSGVLPATIAGTSAVANLNNTSLSSIHGAFKNALVKQASATQGSVEFDLQSSSFEKENKPNANTRPIIIHQASLNSTNSESSRMMNVNNSYARRYSNQAINESKRKTFNSYLFIPILNVCILFIFLLVILTS